MTNKLDQLKAMTVVVADTGDIEAIKNFAPEDATTNPSLLLKAAALPHYQPLIAQARRWAQDQGGSNAEQLVNCSERLAVDIGREILAIVPGRVSTEVDARLSFDSAATVQRARKFIAMYEAAGIERQRILIKIASTWEGIEAARLLEKEGINCNLTLLFGFAQAAACADAGAYLISPFVGRILDWYKANTELEIRQPADDPGVQSVSRIYNYYKQHDYQTIVMGASFRNSGEIHALAGCDRLTISPALLQELAADQGELRRCLSPQSTGSGEDQLHLGEGEFRYHINNDAMVTEKLAEGIRNFVADQVKLEQLLVNFDD
jgi:transaldolase